MGVNNIVTVPALHWHTICHILKFNDGNRRRDFEQYFNCTVTWKSNIDERPNKEPSMLLQFTDPKDATIFALKWA